MVRQRLHAGVRERDPHRIGARRPLRPPHGLRDRHRGVRHRLGARGAQHRPGQLIAARALQGFGGAGVMPLSLALIAGRCRAERRPLAIGIWGGISGLGVAVGPLVGGAVMEGWNWQAIFWINVPVAIIAIPLALFVLQQRLRRPRAHRRRRRRAGRGRRARPRARDRPRQRRRLVLASASSPRSSSERSLLIAFFLLAGAREGAARSAAAVPRPLVLASRTSSGFAFSFGTFGAVFILIQYMQVVQGSTPLEAAVQTTPWTLAPMFVAPIAGIIAPRVGTRALMLTGLLLQGVALAWIGLTLSADLDYAALHRAVHHGRRRHGPRVRAVGDRAARDPRRARPRQGVRRQLDRPRDRHRARHRRA